MKRKAIHLGVAGTLVVLSLAAVAVPAQAAETQPPTPGLATEAAALRSVAAPAAVYFPGAPEVGRSILAPEGYSDWKTPGTTKSYQWLRNGEPIPRETSRFYQVQPADVGNKLSYRVTGSAPGYKSVTRTSGSSIPVPNSTPAPTVTAAGRTPGSVLTAQHQPWYAKTTPVPSMPWLTKSMTMRYQWLRNGVAIPGATTLSYKLTTADLDKSIVLRIQGIDTGKAVETFHTVRVKPSWLKPVTLKSAPYFLGVYGAPSVGSPLSVSGVFGPKWEQSGAKTTYQWLRNGAPIAGATGSAYSPVAADIGKNVTVALTGSLKGYAGTTIEAGTGGLKVEAGAPPEAASTITGTPTVESVLTPKPGTWKTGTTLGYQWLRNGARIHGEDTPTYRVVAADKGAKISVITYGSSPGSNATLPISSAPVTIR